jgi:hypothetical protein
VTFISASTTRGPSNPVARIVWMIALPFRATRFMLDESKESLSLWFVRPIPFSHANPVLTIYVSIVSHVRINNWQSKWTLRTRALRLYRLLYYSWMSVRFICPINHCLAHCAIGCTFGMNIESHRLPGTLIVISRNDQHKSCNSRLMIARMNVSGLFHCQNSCSDLMEI